MPLLNEKEKKIEVELVLLSPWKDLRLNSFFCFIPTVLLYSCLFWTKILLLRRRMSWTHYFVFFWMKMKMKLEAEPILLPSLIWKWKGEWDLKLNSFSCLYNWNWKEE
jgi:hypothetical protein